MAKTAKKDPIEKVLVNKTSLRAMADNVAAISAALEGAFGNEGQLTADAVITLIKREVGEDGPSRDQIGKVLVALKNLKSRFVKAKA